MIVVDASAVLELLLQTALAPAITRRLYGSGESLHAPHLLDIEVAQVLRRYCSFGRLTPSRGIQALQDFTDFPILRYPHAPFLKRIWELRSNFTAYDAAYLALSEALGASLITCDHALASAGHAARVELIGDI